MESFARALDLGELDSGGTPFSLDLDAAAMLDFMAGVAVGDRVQLAVHASARDEPLVVRADVVRDDGAGGLVLRFEELSGPQRLELSRIMAHLPLLTTDQAEGTSPMG